MWKPHLQLITNQELDFFFFSSRNNFYMMKMASMCSNCSHLLYLDTDMLKDLLAFCAPFQKIILHFTLFMNILVRLSNLHKDCQKNEIPESNDLY